MLSWKIGLALAAGNTVILKPFELTPLTALRLCPLLVEAGFPDILSTDTVVSPVKPSAKTCSSAVWPSQAAPMLKSNLKKVTLELGGKSPSIIFNDVDMEQTVKWVAHGELYVSFIIVEPYSSFFSMNQGQACTAGSRIFIQVMGLQAGRYLWTLFSRKRCWQDVFVAIDIEY